MQINHNIRAMVTQHSLFTNNNAMTKSLEKLSTGLRINRAQDDAAGLAMSEQMRTQIRGLGKAKENSLNGQAALQIAEGGLAEITNLMQRQRELAIQSANDTLTSTERKYLNDEFEALTKEIGRIASTTDYNGKNMLNYNPDPNRSFGVVKMADAAGAGASGGLAGTPGSIENAKFTVDIGTANIGSFIYGTNEGAGQWDTGAELASLMNNANFGGTDWTITGEGNTLTFEKKVAGKYADDDTAAVAKFKTDFAALAGNTVTAISTGGTSGVYAINSGNSFSFDFSKLGEGDSIKVGNMITLSYTASAAVGTNPWRFSDATQLATKLKNAMQSAYGGEFDVSVSGDIISVKNKSAGSSGDIGKAASYTLHVGANYSGMWGASGRYGNELSVTYMGLACSVTADGKWTVNIAGVEFMSGSVATLDITTQNKSTEAIDAIDKAIKEVSGTRAAIGTFINRLDYTINNIANLEFNTQDAESRIRDTDFAKETTSFTRNQIMVQSSVSMLAQANSLPQAVLGLLG